MEKKEKYYLTTAIAYVNAAPHIGFTLELIYSDVIARYQRLLGKEVVFLTGTDEHGQKIAHKAAGAGKDPKSFTDEISALYKSLTQELNISNTDFIRTTEERHKKAVAEFWKRVNDRGWIYKKKYSGLYCVGCEQFKTEKDLIHGLCPDHKIKPEMIEEENYFFKLTAFTEQLKNLYAAGSFVVPQEKFNEAIKLVEGGLEDVSISRSTKNLTWGIPVPGDDTQVIYVWFDALINYLSAIGFGEDEERFNQYWPADLHVIGKEINRFHTVLWPAMLLAAGLKPPTRVGVHGWITVDGQKMSKTVGNVIGHDDLIKLFGLEATRYLLLRYIPFHGDGDYSRSLFLSRYESDLANDLGNLLHRVTSMVVKFKEGKVPERMAGDLSRNWQEYAHAFDELKFDEALECVWKIIRECNQSIDQTKPWTLAKEGKEKELDEILYFWLESLRHVAWMISPFMPETAKKILERLGEKNIALNVSLSEIFNWGELKPGNMIMVGEPLFPRIIER